MHNMTPGEFVEMRAFLMVAEERSFRRAARRLSMSPSALSRTIKGMEERLDLRLLNRTTRSVAPTEAGQTLFERLRPTMSELDAALRDVSVDSGLPKGKLRINLPSVAAHMVVAPRLGAFMAAYPDIRLDLAVDNDITDVVADGFDAGVRIGNQISRDMIAVPLGPSLRIAIVASPGYFKLNPFPETPQDLAGHRCLTYRWSNSDVLMPWQLTGSKGLMTVEVESAFTTNDTGLLLTAALQGVGIAYVAETLAMPHVVKGELVRALEDWCQPFPGFHLYYSSRTRMPAALRAFVDFMRLKP
jgi:DNA-binding transcriptional LysR family regulator